MTETVAIVDYGSGNLRSAAKALERAAREAECAVTVVVTDRPAVVAKADRVVLPGVGAFGACRAGLDRIDAMVGVLEQVAVAQARPFLGICVGMQLMATRGLEHGRHPGFAWLAGDVVAIEPAAAAGQHGRLKVPHMGWNALALTEAGTAHPVLDGLAGGDHVYFVHGYHMALADPAQLLATVDYAGALTAIVGRDTLVGTQFHPEKSQRAGLKLLANFLRWQP